MVKNNIDSERLNIEEFKEKERVLNKKIENEHGDLFQVSNKLYEIMNIKIALILFFIYTILNLDIFVENVLCKLCNNTYDRHNDSITHRGIIINGIILSVVYIIIDMLDKKHIL